MYIKVITWAFVILSGMLFYYNMKKERRTLFIGVNLFVFLIMLAFLAMLFVFSYSDIPLVYYFSILLVVGVILSVPIFIIWFVITLFTTGTKLVKREGVTISHLLSLGFGIALIIWIFIFPKLYSNIDNIILSDLFDFITFVFGYFLFVMVLFFVSSLLNLIPHLGKTYDYIIVLGSGLINNEVTPLLASRIEKGIEKHNKFNLEDHLVKVVFSGGQGHDEALPEGEAMANYAIDKGLEQKYIIRETRSKNTEENLCFSYELIKEDWMKRENQSEPEVLVVTNNFHVFRALLIAKKLGIKCDGSGSKTKFYYWLNAIIREYIGVLYLQKKSHLLFLGLGFLKSLFQIIIEILVNRI